LFARSLHDLLALASLVTMGLVVIEAGVRTVRGRPQRTLSLRLRDVVLVLLGATAAGGLALLLLGSRPQELLHLLYAVLVFASVPVGDGLVQRAGVRSQAAGRALAALIGVVLIIRLYGTG
jgi:hypothetical protein